MIDRTTPLLEVVKTNIITYFHNKYYMKSVSTLISSEYMKQELDKMVSRFISEYRSPQPIRLDMLIESIIFIARAGTLSFTLHPEVIRDKGRYNFNINGELIYFDDPAAAIIHAIDNYFNLDDTNWKELSLDKLDVLLCNASRSYTRTYDSLQLDLNIVAQICTIMIYALDKKFISGE